MGERIQRPSVLMLDCRNPIVGGIALLINVDPDCKLSLAGTIALDYHFRQLAARPPEELNELAVAASRLAREGASVAVAGLGEDDDRVCFLAKALQIAFEGHSSLQCPLSRAQELSLSWYERLRELLSVEQLHKLYEVGSLYEFGSGLEHASTVAHVSLDLAQAVGGGTFTRRELRSLYVAGLLHDIGRFVSERGHEEIGVRMLQAHRDALPEDVDIDVASFCIRHHRRHTNPENDPRGKELGERGLLLAAIVRLADAFTNVYEKEDYWGAYFCGDELIVVARHVSRDRFETKGKLLEKIAGVKIRLNQPG